METENQRLKAFADFKKIKDADLARILNITRGTVSGWFNQYEKISDRLLVLLIRKYPDLNARWLITGAGEMLESDGDSNLHEAQGDYGKDFLSMLLNERERVGALQNEVEHINQELLESIKGTAEVVGSSEHHSNNDLFTHFAR